LGANEHGYPGISRVGKDNHGFFVLKDIAAEEIKKMLAECEKEANH